MVVVRGGKWKLIPLYWGVLPPFAYNLKWWGELERRTERDSGEKNVR